MYVNGGKRFSNIIMFGDDTILIALNEWPTKLIDVFS